MKRVNSVRYQSISVLIGTSLILFLRLDAGKGNLFLNSFWAEDGLFTLCNIKATAPACFFNSFSGYWSALPRMNAFFVSQFPIEKWALVNNIFTLVFLAVLATFAYVMIEARFIRKRVPLFLVFAPSIIAGLSHEVLMVNNSIFGILGYFVLLIYLYSDFTNMGFKKSWWAFLVFAVLYTLSNPLASLFALVIVIDQFFYKRRSTNRSIFTIIILIANVVQGLYVLLNHSERHPADVGLALIKSFIFEFIKSFSLLLYSPNDINYFAERNFHSIFFFILIITLIILISVFIAFNFKSLFRLVLSNRQLFFPFLVLNLSLFISILTNGAASRFEVMTALYALLFLTGIFQLQKTKMANVCFAILFSSVLINGFLNFSATELRSTGPEWGEELEIAREFCEKNPTRSTHFIFSPNWTASLQHPYRIQEPTTEIIRCSLLIPQD